MGGSRVAWRPLILGVLVCTSAMGTEPAGPGGLRLADESAAPLSLSTGNRAIDLLLQQPQAEQPAVAASRAAIGKATGEDALAVKPSPAEDTAKLTRDALLREAALFVEQHDQKQAKAARGEVDVTAVRVGTTGRDPSPGAPAALEGWRATVKEFAIALRENREWIIGIAVLVGVAVLSIRALAMFSVGRGGRAGGRYHAGRR